MKINNDVPTVTPWGEPQTAEVLATGIVLFTTTGRGGIWLSPERNVLVPMKLRRATFFQHGLNGWYEEELDAAIVYTIFGVSH
jgi:hypothetical protein